MFPSLRAHDDLADALSLVAHLHDTIYGDPDQYEEPEIVSDICGF